MVLSISAVLEMKDITKIFPGVKALDGVNFRVDSGEVAGLVGENGAGKSTLMNILGGVVKKSAGEIIMNGKCVSINTPHDAQNYGIRFIHQEPKLLLNRNVLSNIYINQYPGSLAGFIPNKIVENNARAILNKLGIGAIDLKEVVKNLEAGERRLIEIARAMVTKDLKILILDEPTAAINANETEILFSVITNLKKEGVSVIYISHRLEEVFKICDRITILRNGKKIQTKEVGQTDINEICNLITGKEIAFHLNEKDMPTKSAVLELRNYTGEGFKNINLSLKKGEIVSLTGLLGAGHFDFARALFGLVKLIDGELIIEGKSINPIKTTMQAVKYGISFLSENRKMEGLFNEKTVLFNCTISSLKKYLDWIILRKWKQKSIVKSYAENMSIKLSSLDQIIKNLSGGNQQKVIISRWLMRDANVFIFCLPTQGIDVGGKRQILSLMSDLSKKGKTLIVISDELDEIISISHRILVFRDKEIIAEFIYPEFDKEKILSCIVGGSNGKHG